MHRCLMSTELPEFNGDGNLPLGDYHPSASSFEARFVSVPSLSRRDIYDGWGRHRAALAAAGAEASAKQLLNGSYTTAKQDPGDIDLVVEVIVPDSRPASVAARAAVLALLPGPGTKATYGCDAYPIVVVPPTDPNYANVTEKGYAYWLKWFGRDRQGREKGRVWATVGGFQ